MSLINLSFFFFNDTATTEIYTLSLHDALPISAYRDRHARRHRRQGGGSEAEAPRHHRRRRGCILARGRARLVRAAAALRDRKSTRLNSSHANISYAVFCLKKKNINRVHIYTI